MTDAPMSRPESSQSQAPQPELSAEAERQIRHIAVEAHAATAEVGQMLGETIQALQVLFRSELSRATREQAEEIARLKASHTMLQEKLWQKISQIRGVLEDEVRAHMQNRIDRDSLRAELQIAEGDVGTRRLLIESLQCERDALRAELERWRRGHVPCSICRSFDCAGHPCE